MAPPQRNRVIVKKLKRAAVYSFLAFFFFTLSLSVSGFYISIQPHHAAPLKTPADFGMPFERVAIKTSDNVRLSAWWIHNENKSAARRPVILLLHGYHSSKEDLLSVTSFLFPSFDALMSDFRAHGESGGRFTTIGARETLDVKAATAFLNDKGYKRIGIFGFSMGGAVALQMCGEKEVHAIVTDSAYANLGEMIESRYSFLVFSPLKLLASVTTRILSRIFFGIFPDTISPEEDLHTCSVPVFAMHATRDPLVPVAHAGKIKEALQGRKHSRVWILEAYGHGTLHVTFGKQYESRILTFFKKHLTLMHND